jgi:hypothetical protein
MSSQSVKSEMSLSSSLILGSSIIITGIILAFALHSFRSFDRYVEVRGLDEQIIKSDSLIWNISLAVSANSSAELYTKISSESERLLKLLQESGFQENEISQSGNLTLTNNKQYNEKALFTYTLRGSITVNSHNVDLALKLSQNPKYFESFREDLENQSLRFLFQGLNSIKPQMVEKALANGHEVAEKFAQSTKSKLGEIKNAGQGLFTITSKNEEFDDGGMEKKVRVTVKTQYFLK